MKRADQGLGNVPPKYHLSPAPIFNSIPFNKELSVSY